MRKLKAKPKTELPRFFEDWKKQLHWRDVEGTNRKTSYSFLTIVKILILIPLDRKI